MSKKIDYTFMGILAVVGGVLWWKMFTKKDTTIVGVPAKLNQPYATETAAPPGPTMEQLRIMAQLTQNQLTQQQSLQNKLPPIGTTDGKEFEVTITGGGGITNGIMTFPAPLNPPEGLAELLKQRGYTNGLFGLAMTYLTKADADAEAAAVARILQDAKDAGEIQIYAVRAAPMILFQVQKG